jgi:hypothetical protein
MSQVASCQEILRRLAIIGSPACLPPEDMVGP